MEKEYQVDRTYNLDELTKELVKTAIICHAIKNSNALKLFPVISVDKFKIVLEYTTNPPILCEHNPNKVFLGSMWKPNISIFDELTDISICKEDANILMSKYECMIQDKWKEQERNMKRNLTGIALKYIAFTKCLFGHNYLDVDLDDCQLIAISNSNEEPKVIENLDGNYEITIGENYVLSNDDCDRLKNKFSSQEIDVINNNMKFGYLRNCGKNE